MREAQNLRHVEEVMENDFGPSLNEFAYLNDEVAGLLSEDEKKSDQELWFASKMAFILDFMKEPKKWIAEVHESALQKENEDEDDLQDAVKISDSVSQIGVGSAQRICTNGSQVGSAVSRVSSVRVKQEAEHAALLERVAAQKKRQELEI